MLRRMAALLVVGILALVIPATAHENAPASTKSGKATQTATTATSHNDPASTETMPVVAAYADAPQYFPPLFM